MRINNGVLSGVTNRDIKNGTFDFPEDVTYIGFHCFEGCTDLEHVEIPKRVTGIDGNAFSRCSNLKSVVIPNSVEEIGPEAFSSCRSLKNINIPKNTRVAWDLFILCGNKESALKREIDFRRDASETKQQQASGENEKDSSLLTLTKDKIKATAMEGISYARIGLNSEHGKYGTIFFETEDLRDSKENPNVMYLPMEAKRGYNVVFQGKNGQPDVVPMMGADIVSGNKAFMKESNRQRTAELEARLQGQYQTPQQQEQAEM